MTTASNLLEASRMVRAAFPTAAQAAENLRKAAGLFYHYTPPCQCTRETFREGPAPGCTGCYWLKVWTYHYSDGTTEQLKTVERRIP
jgi:hypothetical protein